jgi:Ca-activated chloride channel family protein
LGFGTGNYQDAKMEQLADKGNGNYAYVDNLLEAKKVLVKEMGATLYTIAKDVKIQIEFNPAKVKSYRLIGYENRVLANEDFNDDKKDAGEIGSGHAVTALYEIIPSTSDEETDNIDSLKYQKVISNVANNELMTVKFRYKEPNDTTSKLIVETLLDKPTAIDFISDNFKFATAVVEFGALLRDSKYKGYSNYTDLIAMAKEAKGKDEDGYRAEFIRLAETCEILARDER